MICGALLILVTLLVILLVEVWERYQRKVAALRQLSEAMEPLQRDWALLVTELRKLQEPT